LPSITPIRQNNWTYLLNCRTAIPITVSLPSYCSSVNEKHCLGFLVLGAHIEGGIGEGIDGNDA